MSKSKDLKQAIKKRLIPFFVERGFEVHPLPKWLKDGGRQDTSPFGLLKRRRGDDLQLVEVQLDPRNPGRFHIGFGVAGISGLKRPWITLTQDEMAVAEVSVPYNLLANRYFMTRFSGGWFARNSQESAERAVTSALSVVSEVEDLFETGKVGPHVRTG